MTVHVFVGPTLPASRVVAIASEARLHPPVAHGDLLRLDARQGDVVVIIDGVYHHSGSVRHKEVLDLLAREITVVGCSSIGALRAAELWQFGMVGNGRVFEMYRTGEIDADDEVAVAHSDGPEYRQFNEPLVNIRCALAEAQRAGVLIAMEAAAIVEKARALPYTDRTWRRIETVTDTTGFDVGHAVRRLRSFLVEHPDHANVKAADAADTLARLDVLITPALRNLLDWTKSPDWRSRHLYEWTANFAGAVANDVWVEHGSVIRYRQIYDPNFPRQWRTFVLRQIVASFDHVVGETDDELTERVLKLASDRGLTADSLTADQESEWILVDTERNLPTRELVLRVLARSYRPPRGIYDLLSAEPDWARDDVARLAVAESYMVNAEIARWRHGGTVDHIKESALRDHLRETWTLSSDSVTALNAGARDRGFASLADATAAARPFFLRHRLRLAEPAEMVLDGSEP